MQRKPAAMFLLDSHAGAGGTDLAGDAAMRTGEWRAGIGRLLAAAPCEALADYLALVRGFGAGRYPGSPLLLGAMLRPQDRLACCELHPEESAALRRRFAHASQVAAHARDGWQAIAGLLPPASARRGTA